MGSRRQPVTKNKTPLERKIALLQSDGYFRIRDFEYVQPLYDLAFFLEVDALAKGSEVPKYRTFSLWRAAYSLDGYAAVVDRWLDGAIEDADLDYVPSGRIRQYLAAVRLHGTIPELKPFKGERFERCLRLRSIRGLGPRKIALTISSRSPDEEWFSQIALSVALDRDRLVDLSRRNIVGPWQCAHIVPPMLRFLRTWEISLGDREVFWNIDGIDSPFEPVSSLVSVKLQCDSASFSSALAKTLRKEKLFGKIAVSSDGVTTIRHQMGWAFTLSVGEVSDGRSLPQWAVDLDPFACAPKGKVVSDLHLHTAWSDGSASVETMGRAISERGLSYFAVTDHSRSSKLQNGLTPPLWLRQANALTLAAPVCPVLHGIEVDILRDGELDLPGSLLRAADIVVASVHSNWSDNIEVNTSRLVRAIQSGWIDVLAHPTSALSGKPGIPDYVRPPAEVDWDQVFRQCSLWRVAVEFNCFPSRMDLPVPMLRRAAELGCAVSLGSDAHSRSHLQNIRFGEAVLHHVDAPLVLNCLSLVALTKWISDARTLRQGLSRTSISQTQGELFALPDGQTKRSIDATIQSPKGIPRGSKIVGIDLTGSEKATGIALLTGMTSRTCSLLSDDDILAYVAKHKPKIVSIDSPLGLPGGGTSINPQAGIVRVAEHDLASIGIPAYPALIDSMRELTLRGIRLRSAIERLPNAPVVIESYPGAAQDILCIPRKQKGLDLLREGLRRLGLRGPGLQTNSHDEMDAVTSAIVGRYFESNQFEPMGISREAQLIVPKVHPLRFDPVPVICLAGKTGAGKSVVARYLSVFYGFEWLQTRNVVRDLLAADLQLPETKRLYRGDSDLCQMTETDLRLFGACLLDDHQQLPVQLELTRQIRELHGPVVVDSVRELVDVQENQLNGRCALIWFIDCNDSIIKNRVASKSKLGEARLKSASPVDYTAPLMKKAADRILNNNGSLEELRWRIDDTLFKEITLHAH